MQPGVWMDSSGASQAIDPTGLSEVGSWDRFKWNFLRHWKIKQFTFRMKESRIYLIVATQLVKWFLTQASRFLENAWSSQLHVKYDNFFRLTSLPCCEECCFRASRVALSVASMVGLNWMHFLYNGLFSTLWDIGEGQVAIWLRWSEFACLSFIKSRRASKLWSWDRSLNYLKLLCPRPTWGQIIRDLEIHILFWKILVFWILQFLQWPL